VTIDIRALFFILYQKVNSAIIIIISFTRSVRRKKAFCILRIMGSRLIDASILCSKEFFGLSTEDKQKIIHETSKALYTKDDVLKVVPMTFGAELFAMTLFLFGVPGAVFSIPVLIILVAVFTSAYKLVFSVSFVILLLLTISPAPFQEKSLHSWYALQILRYFSFKGIFEEPLKKDRPYILVAPPHGVFPFGNIATMIAFPSVMGFSFRALAASAALIMPVFKQLLGTIGAVDASRSTALKVLCNKLTLGISTGGVAEIFETNATSDGNEVIVLENRKGIVRLAMQSGAALVPCYLFGNTQLLSLWAGGSPGSTGNRWLQSISRQLGIALILFWGRFGLPIPYRVPIVGVMGKPIEVPLLKEGEKLNEEVVDLYHKILKEEMIKLFDKHKAMYGWENKQLVIC
jgi:diacylglycerol O-acyltransferase 2, plant